MTHPKNRTTWMALVAAAVSGVLAGLAPVSSAVAQMSDHMPKPWQLWLQQPSTPVAEGIYDFHVFLLYLIVAIAVFVLALMIYVCVKFKASANPNPSRTTHHTMLEIVWTLVPVLILIAVAIPSIKLLKYADKAVDPDMTIKVVANQWFWTYEYPDEEIAFSSYLIRANAPEFDPEKHTRLLDVDNRLVVPVGKEIQVLVTSNDVFHSFFVPSAMVQIYAIGGRTNETWMQFNEPGVYYGQCNQICGIDHSNMPIVIEAVSEDAWAKWLETAKQQWSTAEAGRVTTVASAIAPIDLGATAR